MTTAFGANVHFKKGGTPSCTITGNGTTSTSTTCTGSVAGLGNDNVNIDTIVSGSAVYECQNQGGNVAAGQNKVLIGPSTQGTPISRADIKNGNLTFTTTANTLTAAATASAAVAGCPNDNWQGVNPKLTVTDVTLNFYQPPNTLVFTCSASNPNGLPSTFTFTNCTI